MCVLSLRLALESKKRLILDTVLCGNTLIHPIAENLADHNDARRDDDFGGEALSGAVQ